MSTSKQWSVCAIAALLSASFLLLPLFAVSTAQANAATHRRVAPARAQNAPAPATAAQPKQLPPRTQFSEADEAAAIVPGMPDARFWADSTTDFKKALPSQPGPWLALSSGGSDGAFGAGLLNGLSAAGNRPDYSVVTGVSTGALMAPLIFAGPKYDGQLRDAFTKVTAADIFEARPSGESFADTWPLKELIAKQITPALLADIAAEHRRGRRLFVTTTDLDAERSVVWNMGAIAAHGGDDALALFRSVLLASSAIPGFFPPVLIDVEANGKRFAEMHADGGIGGQFFVAPPALMASTSDYHLPATRLYVVINTELEPDFQVFERSIPAILTQSVGAAVMVDTRLMIDRAYLVAKRGGVAFNIASIPQNFAAPSRGPFDPQYMAALFQAGYELGKSATPFGTQPPPYPEPPALQPSDPEKTGANR